MDKYYFVDEKPNDVPGYYKGAFVVAAIGTQISPNLNLYLGRTDGILQGVVHKVRISAEYDAFDNVSWFKDALNGLEQKVWNTLPIVVWLYKSAVNLDILNTYVGEFVRTIPVLRKPLLYVTKAMWDGWMKGDNSEMVAKTILSKADIILADWTPQIVELPQYCPSVQWIESEQGIIYNDPTGEFDGINDPVVEPPPPQEDPEDPPPPPVVNPSGLNITITGRWGLKKIDLNIKS